MSRPTLLGIAVTGLLAGSLAAVPAHADEARTSSTPNVIPQVTPPEPAERPVIPDGSVAVTDFGAAPDDGADDTAGIQAAVDAMGAAGGGTVWFPSGTYDVSIDPEDQVGIVVASGVRLAAEETRESVLRLGDAQGDFFALFATFPGAAPDASYEKKHDVVIDGLVIDMNAAGNPIHDSGNPFGFTYLGRGAGRFDLVERLLITGCEFRNMLSVTVILVNRQDNTDLIVEHSRFVDIGGAPRDYDHSSIYLKGYRSEITHNVFASRNGPGTFGARSAVETHGSDAIVRHNRVLGYQVGVNVTGATFEGTSDRQDISYNVLDGVSMGFYLYHRYFPALDFTSGPSLRNITIAHNAITVDADGWAGILPNTPRVGLQLQPADDAPIDRLAIVGNSIRFENTGDLVANRSYVVDSYTSGIAFWSIESLDRPDVAITNFEIRGNYISGALSSGIWSGVPLVNGEIAGNVVVDPGENGNFDPPKAGYGEHYLPFVDHYRSGVYIGSDITDVSVTGNVVHSANPLSFGVVAAGTCLTSCQADDNVVTRGAAPAEFLGPGWTD